MIKLNISKKDLGEILEDIKRGYSTCPMFWNLKNPNECQEDCIACLIETVLKNTEEITIFERMD